MEFVSNQRVVWMTNSLGYGDDLLYWGPILSRYVRAFPQSQFFTAADGRKPIPASTHVVHRLSSLKVPLGKRRFSYDRHIRIVSPRTIGQITRLNPAALVVSEFTMPSLYATRIRKRLGIPILLLVESDPLRGNPSRIRWLGRKLRSHIASRVDWVLTNNIAGKRYLEQQLQIAPDRITCRPYVVSEVASGNEVATVDRRVEFGGAGKIVFLFVGQMVERKGLSRLLDEVANLTSDERQRCCFWLIGDGAERASLQNQIQTLELDTVVRLLGKRPYSELSDFYRSADVFVMPTMDDYRALVGFEALSYGLPLVHSCYDGAAEEIVNEGRNGFIVNPRESGSLAGGIRRILALGKKLQSYGEHSLQLSKQFTVRSAVDSLVDATNRCLGTQ